MDFATYAGWKPNSKDTKSVDIIGCHKFIELQTAFEVEIHIKTL
jgi:hypothetical protein